MISFLASPKSFVGRTGIQQRNAIASWLSVIPSAEVILYGRAGGAKECARAFGAVHVEDIDATAQGIPYFGAIAEHANLNAKHEMQVYLNCDILLSRDIAVALRRIKHERFLMIGQRIDLAEGEGIRVDEASMLRQLRHLAQRGGATLHPPSGADYFAFRRGTWRDLPPIIIGRGGYDNALVAHCLRYGIPVIDATFAVLAVHQFHEYQHVAGGLAEVFKGADAQINLATVPSGTNPNIECADYVLRGSALRRNCVRGDLVWYAYLWACLRGYAALARVLNLCWRASRRLGIARRWTPTVHEVLGAIEHYSTSTCKVRG